jgi:hypothetical protein
MAIFGVAFESEQTAILDLMYVPVIVWVSGTFWLVTGLFAIDPASARS